MNLPEAVRLWKWGILVAVLIWALVSMFHIVPPEKEGVVTRLGSYSRTVGPGVKWTLPAPFEQMRMEDVRAIRTMQIGAPDASDANFVLTRDQSIVDLAYEVRWSLRDPEMFIFQLDDPEGTIPEVAESALRAAGAKFTPFLEYGAGRPAERTDRKEWGQ